MSAMLAIPIEKRASGIGVCVVHGLSMPLSRSGMYSSLTARACPANFRQSQRITSGNRTLRNPVRFAWPRSDHLSRIGSYERQRTRIFDRPSRQRQIISLQMRPMHSRLALQEEARGFPTCFNSDHMLQGCPSRHPLQDVHLEGRVVRR